MKHIYLNLKRFDISPDRGGVNRIAPMAQWGKYVVSNIQKELKNIRSTFDAHLRAPKGGVSIKGKEFKGGEFIPSEGGYAEEYEKMQKEGKSGSSEEPKEEKSPEKKTDKKEKEEKPKKEKKAKKAEEASAAETDQAEDKPKKKVVKKEKKEEAED